MRSVFNRWEDVSVAQLNRLLRPFNVRLVVRRKKGDEHVLITAEAVPVERKDPPAVPSST